MKTTLQCCWKLPQQHPGHTRSFLLKVVKNSDAWDNIDLSISFTLKSETIHCRWYIKMGNISPHIGGAPSFVCWYPSCPSVQVQLTLCWLLNLICVVFCAWHSPPHATKSAFLSLHYHVSFWDYSLLNKK